MGEKWGRERFGGVEKNGKERKREGEDLYGGYGS